MTKEYLALVLIAGLGLVLVSIAQVTLRKEKSSSTVERTAEHLKQLYYY
jgi:hypothetical protein